MRGFNESDKPKGVMNYLPETVAADIKELIFSLNEKKANIIGHDWGGAIAWTMAQKFPDCVDHLIVLNCPIPQLMGKALLTNFRQMRRSWYMLYFQLPFLPEWGMRRNLKLFFTKALRGWSRNKKAFSNEDIMEYVKAFHRPEALTGAINYYRAGLANFFRRGANKVSRISADTLLIWGEDDEALGKELTFGMEKYFTGKFEIKYISDCSHWVQHEQPEVVNQMIIDFLQ